MIGGEIGRPDSNSTGPGDPDADAPQAPRDVLRRAQQRPEQGVDPLEAALRAVLDARRLVVVAQDPAIEARDGHVDAGRAEIGHEDVPGLGAEGELPRRASAGTRSDVALGDEPAIDELLDAARHDRPAEARPGHQLRARTRPPEPDLVEDHDEGIEDLVGQGRVATPFQRGRLGYELRPAVGHGAMISRCSWRTVARRP